MAIEQSTPTAPEAGRLHGLVWGLFDGMHKLLSHLGIEADKPVPGEIEDMAHQAGGLLTKALRRAEEIAPQLEPITSGIESAADMVANDLNQLEADANDAAAKITAAARKKT